MCTVNTICMSCGCEFEVEDRTGTFDPEKMSFCSIRCMFNYGTAHDIFNPLPEGHDQDISIRCSLKIGMEQKINLHSFYNTIELLHSDRGPMEEVFFDDDGNATTEITNKPVRNPYE